MKKRNRKKNRKLNIDATQVAQWYSDYKDALHTYCVYVLWTDNSEKLVLRGLLYAARISAARKGNQDPLSLALLGIRQSNLKKARGANKPLHLLQAMRERDTDAKSRSGTPYSSFYTLGQQEHQSEAQLWMEQILQLPKKDREVFVLREVIGLSSKRTSQIVKTPSVNVEARLHKAMKTLDSTLHTRLSNEALTQLMSSPVASTEPIIGSVLRSQLQIQLPIDSQNTDETWLMNTFSHWQRQRRRKRLVMGTAIPGLFVIAVGIASFVYQPWTYFLGPSQPNISSPTLRVAYINTLGFVPRIPSQVPSSFTSTYSVWQQDFSGGMVAGGNNPYVYTYLLRSKNPARSIQIIENRRSSDNFNYIGQNSNVLPDMKINHVNVSLTQGTYSFSARFKINSVSYVVSAQWPGNTQAVTKADITALVRSMIIHPKKVTAKPDYQVSSFSGISALQKNLDFNPIVSLTTLPKSMQTGPMQANGSIIIHKQQKYETCDILYGPPEVLGNSTNGTQSTNSQPQYQLDLQESKGSIDMIDGPKESASQDSGSWTSSITIEGQQVHVNGTSMFWYSKQSGVGYRAQVTPIQLKPGQSLSASSVQSGAKKLLTQVMTQVIANAH